MPDKRPHTIVAAINEALEQGTIPFLGKRDREALERVKELASVRELRLSAEAARVLVHNLVEARRIQRSVPRSTVKKMIANTAVTRETLLSYSSFIGDDVTFQRAFALVESFISTKFESLRDLRLPRQSDANTARAVAAAHISKSVLGLTDKWNDRIVLDLVEAMVGWVSHEGLKRATGRHK
jgi:hypothetical protein